MKKYNTDKSSSLAMTGTKLRLFKVAVDLFAKKGYASVGIRDIAEAAGVKSANIYNHFKNKDALLEEMFEFYRRKYYESYPELEDLLAQVPVISPHKLLANLHVSFGEDIDLLAKICLIALEERDRDPRAESLMAEVFIDGPKRYLSAVLSKMIELEIIEPLNIDAFISVVTGFNAYLAVRSGGNRAMSLSEWQSGYELILTMVREKTKK